MSIRSLIALVLASVFLFACMWFMSSSRPEISHRQQFGNEPPITNDESKSEAPEPAKVESLQMEANSTTFPKVRNQNIDQLLAGEVLSVAEYPTAEPQNRIRSKVILAAKNAKYPKLACDEWVRTEKENGVARDVVVGRRIAVADQVIVRLKPGTNDNAFAQLNKTVGATILRKLRGKNPSYVMKLDRAEAGALAGAIRAFSSSGIIAYAEPDYILSAVDTPNDPGFSQSWALNNNGQTGGTLDADVDAPEAWSFTTGSASVIVGVIDTGIDLTHPDLIPNLWQNSGETGLDSQGNDKRTNGIDDDNDGLVDDVYGWNFVSDNNNPSDDHFHGTHCAGIIGAAGNNSIGVTGVCWNVRMMALKFLDANGNGLTSDAVDAINFATAHGAKLTSNSWGGGPYSQALKDAIDAAGAAGSLFICAAGNYGGNLEVYADYPASYTSSNKIAVAATDHNDQLASFSNYGTQSVQLGAPGVNIYSTLPVIPTTAMASYSLSPSYGNLSGTSMACPHVAGAAALLLAYSPNANVAAQLVGRVDVIPSLTGRVSSKGRLNIYNMLNPLWTPGPVNLVTTSVAFGDGEGNNNTVADAGEIVSFAPSITNVGGQTANQAAVRIECSDSFVTLLGTAQRSLGTIGRGSTVAVGEPFRVQLSNSIPDEYTVSFRFIVSNESQDHQTYSYYLPVSVRGPVVEKLVSFKPGGIERDPWRNVVYMTDLTENAILALDTNAVRTVARSFLDASLANVYGDPGRLSVSQDGTRIAVCLSDAFKIQILSLPGLSPISTFTVPFRPTQVVFGVNNRLYACASEGFELYQLDASTGAVLSTFHANAPHTTFPNPLLRTNAAGTRLYVANTGMNVLGIGWIVQFDLSGPYPTEYHVHPMNQRFTRDVVLDEQSHLIYVGDSNGLWVLNTDTDSYNTRLDLELGGCTGITFQPGLPYLYRSGSAGGFGAISKLRLDSGLDVGVYPRTTASNGLKMTPNGRVLYTTTFSDLTIGSWNKVGLIGATALNVEVYPTARIVVNRSSGPAPLQIQFDGSYSNDPDAGGSITSYEWDFADGTTATGSVVLHTFPNDGTYNVCLKVRDVEGLPGRTYYQIVVNSAAPVSITAVDPTAYESSSNNGKFLISRTEAASTSVAVNLQLTGTASIGVDYNTIPLTATIPANARSVEVIVAPVQDNLVEGDETVTATLLPGTGYSIDSASNATVTIQDDDNYLGKKLLPASSVPSASRYGSSVAISEIQDFAVLGTGAGNAIYVYTPVNGNWPIYTRLVGTDTVAGDQFGCTVAASGDTIAVGARGKTINGNAAGSIYIFVRSGGTWTQQTVIAPPNPATTNYFGQTLTLSGDTLVVGNIYDSTRGSVAGAAHVYTRTNNVWSLQTTLYGNDTTANHAFGSSVSLTGNRLAVGATGARAVYVFDRSGTTWSQNGKLVPADSPTNFGFNISVSGSSVAVGTGSSNVYIFTQNAGVWNSEATLTVAKFFSDDAFGPGVALNGNTLAVCASNRDDFGTDAGLIYLYTRSNGVWGTPAAFPSFDASTHAGQSFGSAVAISGTLLVAGAQYDADVNAAGAGYVIDLTSIIAQSARNQAPVITSANGISATPNPVQYPGTMSLSVQATDDGKPASPGVIKYTWSKVSGPGSATFSPNGSTTSNNTTASFTAVGDYMISVGVFDGQYTTLAYIRVRVDANALRPVAYADVIFGVEDTPVSFTLRGFDPRGQALTYIITTQPTRGTISGTAPNLTYTPYPNANSDYINQFPNNGVYALTYKVRSGTLDSDPQTVRIFLASVNDAPVAPNVSINCAAGIARNITVSATDVDNNVSALSYLITRQPLHGTVTLGTGAQFIYRAASDYRGPDSFGFKASDGLLLSTEANVAIQVYQGYNVVDLSNIGGSSSEGRAVNDNLSVVGWGYNSSGRTRAIRWQNGVATELGTLGGNNSDAYDINSNGAIVGWSENSSNFKRPVLWQGGSIQDLGVIAGNTGEAHGINANGDIAGYSSNAFSTSHACVWRGGVITDLGSFGGNSFSSGANGINASGVIVGTSTLSNFTTRAFKYENNVMTDLGTISGSSVGWALNDAGVFACNSNQSFLHENGVLTGMGVFQPTSVNNSKLVVGFTGSPGFGSAMIWQNGALVDLNDLVPMKPNRKLVTARDINSNGAIVGQAQESIGSHAYLLTLYDNTAPVITTAPWANPDPVSGFSTELKVIATDADAMPLPLTFTWSKISGPGSVGFLTNQSTNAHTTTAVFSASGAYQIAVAVSDGDKTTSASLSVIVQRTPGTISISPSVISLASGSSQDFIASVYDQYGLLIEPTPALTWTLDAGSAGSIDPSGRFTSNAVDRGTAIVRASLNGVSGVAQVNLIFSQITPTLTWNTPLGIVYGTPLSPAQLNATASVAGTFQYTPAEGTILNAGIHTLSVLFTPADPETYTNATAQVSINVAKAVPNITWLNPPNIVYGTLLSGAQLNAVANVPGVFTYTPANGTLLSAGNSQTLSASFVPTDSANYTAANASVFINVLKSTPVITWGSPADIVYGTPLGTTQLNATANVGGTFSYNPASGTVLQAGNAQTLTVSFVPNDTNNYASANSTVLLNVLKASPVITWSNPANIVFGTALSATQLNATANIPGVFLYSPGAGTVLPRGNGQTLSLLFDPQDDTNYQIVNATVTINVLNASPTFASGATANPNPVRIGQTVTLSASATDPENDTLTYSWNFGDGSAASSGASCSHIYSSSGDFIATVTVSDGKGGSAVSTVSVHVSANATPTVAIAASSSANPQAGGSSTLSVLGADDLGESGLTYTWAPIGTPPGAVTFSVNNTNASKNTVATFQKVGTYTLQVTIRDAENATATSSVNVTVTPVTVTFQDGVNNYAGTRDTNIKSGSSNANFGSVTTVEINGGNTDIGGLIKWDLTSIPAGSTIQSVQITLNVTNLSTQSYNIFELKRAWVETTATWKAFNTGQNWQTAGATGVLDRGTTSLGIVSVSATGSRTTTLNAAGVAVVQNWVNNASSNNGFTFQNYAATSDNAVFTSREGTTVSARPKITITYAP